jgi:hypothetical protein
MTIQIRVDGLRELEAKLGMVASREWITAGLLAGGLYIKGKVAKYPPARHAPQPFVSDHQRRGFFAKLRAGLIDVPYKRGISPGSERLGQSWTAEARDQGMTVVIGNDASYAPLVHDMARQTGYHKLTGWKTTEEVVKEERDKVVRKMTEHLRRALGR